MSLAAPLRVQGIDVHVEGEEGGQTLLMVHGWPDTLRLWDATVDALKAHHRCVRFTLPGFDLAQPPRATSLAAMGALFADIADAVSPGRPVTLVLHDWGCVFGYEFAMRHPERVARIVGVDVGDHHSTALRAALGRRGRWRVFRYQCWLAIGWLLGRIGLQGPAQRITLWQSRLLRCPAAPHTIGWQMNYPYAMKWLGLRGGLDEAAPVEPACPMLFVYGNRKYFNFHSPAWAQRLAARPGSAVVGLSAGHWVMLNKPAEFHACVAKWLAEPNLDTFAKQFDATYARMQGDVAAQRMAGAFATAPAALGEAAVQAAKELPKAR